MAYRDGITKRKDGTYMARGTILLNNGTKKRFCYYGKTKTEAKEKRTNAIIQSRNGGFVDTTRITVQEYLRKWSENITGVKSSTKYKYIGELEKHVIPRIGAYRMSAISARTIQTMMNDLIEAGNSVRTTQIIRNILSRAFREATLDNLIKPNIMENVRLNPYRPKPRKIWTPQQIAHFLETAKEDRYYIFFILYAEYGLRRGEALAIQVQDIDLKNKIIHINKQFTSTGNKYEITTLKTARSERSLPILPEIEKLILPLIENKTKNDYLISNDGNPIKPTSINYHFKKLTQKANLPPVTLHSFRHYAATALKNAGVEIKDTQEILGHSSPATTIKYYQHSSSENMLNALNKTVKNLQLS